MTKSEFYSELESLLEQEPGSIQGTESLADLGGWDSMAVLSFIAFADSKLGEAVAPAALAACRSVQDLVNLFPGKIK
ncbi:MAG: phosphopantetheine-binding protein [Verrucomicrobiota bacterium]|jgi:acyl carrier protein